MEYVTRQEYNSMQQEIIQLKESNLRQETILQEIRLLLHGSKTLGIDSFKEKQDKDELFKQNIEDELEKLSKKIDSERIQILEGVDRKLEPIVSWKSKVEIAFDIITSAKFWAVIILVLSSIIIISMIMITKLNASEELKPKTEQNVK